MCLTPSHLNDSHVDGATTRVYVFVSWIEIIGLEILVQPVQMVNLRLNYCRKRSSSKIS